VATVVADSGLTIVDRLGLYREVAVEHDSAIYLPLEHSPASLLYRGAAAQNCPLVWSANGRHLYFADNGLVDIDPATRHVSRIDLPDGLLPIDTLSCSSDGADLVFLGRTGQGKHVYHLARTRRALRRIDGPRSSGGSIFSADLNWQQGVGLLRLVGDQLMHVDLVAGGLIQSFTLPLAADTPRLSPLGDAAAFGAQPGLCLLTLSTGDVSAGTRFGCLPAWSPDGRAIVYTSWPGELWRMGVHDMCAQRLLCFEGDPRVRRAGPSLLSTPVWSPDGRYVWITLSTSERTRAPTNEMIRVVVDGDWSMVPAAEQQQAIAETIEELHWEHPCVSGLIDFVDGTVCLNDGFVPSAAWSPVERATSAMFTAAWRPAPGS
jgi:hypothetical protein